MPSDVSFKEMWREIDTNIEEEVKGLEDRNGSDMITRQGTPMRS